jgi:tRNA pseudouridine32 synthase/23S rRNA pseudouridine746 synthase
MNNNSFYELLDNNEDFIVIDKNPNVSFHSENNEKGLFAKLKEDFKINLYAVHRLDKITSGILIVAKTAQVASDLSKLFSSRAVNKYYLAISEKKPKKKTGLVSGDMKKARNGQWKLIRTYENPAITRFFSVTKEDKFLFLLKPQTGKTHQIRVAMKSLGSPILGDVLYGGKEADRGYLHSYKLSFVYKGIMYDYEKYPDKGIFFNKENTQERFTQMISLL